MRFPETPITELPETATEREVIDKLNELIRAINGMWNPQDGTQ